MNTFVIAAVLLTAAALMFLLPALLRANGAAEKAHDDASLAVLRDQARELDADLAAGLIDAHAHREARSELERRVGEDLRPVAPMAAAAPQRALALGLVLALPLLAGALYFKVGNPAGAAWQAPAQEEPHPMSNADIGAMVEALAQRLQREPGDAEGWDMLARSYSVMGRYREAADAYARLVALMPNDASVLADYADVLATAQGGKLQGEPEKLLARALEADPRNVKALALAGSAAFERGDYALAEQRWQQVLGMVPADSDFARSTSASIAQARARQQGAAAQGPAAGPARLAGTVELDPALRGKVAAGDVVFIFARAADGPRMPLAVLRKQVSDLPLRFVLDDSMSMTPDRKLSSVDKVVVGARIARGGKANASPGDLEGWSAPINGRDHAVRIRIDTIRK